MAALPRVSLRSLVPIYLEEQRVASIKGRGKQSLVSMHSCAWFIKYVFWEIHPDIKEPVV